MAKPSDAKNAVGSVQTGSIQDLIQKSAAELGKALPSHMNPERMCRIALTTLRTNKKLMSCDPRSFLAALFQSAQLGLEPNVEGQAYIIPYGSQAQFQIGYKGYVELFYRHQNAVSLDMQEVKENDDFDFQYGTESYLRHKPADSDRGETVKYYAVAKMKDGASIFKVMTKQDCLDHGIKFSKCYDKKKGEFYSNTPWMDNFDAMAMKTVLIQLMKLVPKSIEIQKAMAMDYTVKSSVKADMFEVPDESETIDVESEEFTVENEEGKEPESEELFQG